MGRTMASLPLHCSGSPPQSILGFHRRSFRPTFTATVSAVGPTLPPGPAPCPLHFGFKKAGRLQARQSLVAVFASNTNPSNQNSVEEKSDWSKTSDAGQGPPFLAILAGFLVFFLVCWIIGSIIMWLIGLIVHLLSSK